MCNFLLLTSSFYFSLPLPSRLPLAQPLPELRDPLAHQHRRNAKPKQQNARASHHQDGRDRIQQVIDQNVDHTHHADHQEEDRRKGQTARADEDPIRQHRHGLQEQHHKVDQSLRAVAHHLNVGRAQQHQLRNHAHDERARFALAARQQVMLQHAKQSRAHRIQLRLVGIQLKKNDEVRQQIQTICGKRQPDIFPPEGFDRPKGGGKRDGDRRIHPADKGCGYRDDDSNSKPAE